IRRFLGESRLGLATSEGGRVHVFRNGALTLRASTRTTLLGLLDVGGCLLDASFDQFGFYFRLLANQKRNFSLKTPVAWQLDFNAMLARTDHQSMAGATQFAGVANILAIKKNGCACGLNGELEFRCNGGWACSGKKVQRHAQDLCLS